MSERYPARLLTGRLAAAALTAALLLIFSSCRSEKPANADTGPTETVAPTETETETDAPAETEIPTETETQTETETPAETATEPETDEPEPTEPETDKATEPEPTETVTPPETDAPEPDTVGTEPPPSGSGAGEDIYLQNGDLTPVNYDSPAVLRYTGDAGQEYIDNIVFLCDSPFYLLKYFGILSDGYDTKQIWTGPEGTMTLGYLHDFLILDPIDGVLRTIPEAVAIHKPPTVVITVGINGVALLGEAGFKAEYASLIEDIKAASPDTAIIAQSILPITTWYHNWGMFTNAKSTRANAWILEVAEQCGIHYLDTYAALAGEDGNLRPEYAVNTDGLHPNADGLRAALWYIRTHAYIP